MTRRRSVLPLLLAMSALLACGPVSDASGADDDHAVILLYHHVSTDTPAATSVSPAIFDAHLEYLADNGYNVLPLAEIVAALEASRPLPPQSVAITFDDGYISILTEATPRLARRGWPFTVFVSTDAIDQGYAGFMDWDELRAVEANGGTIANHTATHAHLVRRAEGESGADWRRRVADDIGTSARRLDAELDRPARRLLAWPYGEFNRELEQLALREGYVAFGQQSGPAGYGSNLQSLPRFPMATGFADLDGLRDKLATRPLPVTVLAPGGRELTAPARPPVLELQVEPGPFRLDAMRCYVAGQEPATTEQRGNRVTITARAPLRPGRGKFNCTVPSSDESGVYYWYSHLWLQRNSDGSWYDE